MCATHMQAGRAGGQAGGRAGRQAGGRAGRQADRQTGRQADTHTQINMLFERNQTCDYLKIFQVNCYSSYNSASILSCTEQC